MGILPLLCFLNSLYAATARCKSSKDPTERLTSFFSFNISTWHQQKFACEPNDQQIYMFFNWFLGKRKNKQLRPVNVFYNWFEKKKEQLTLFLWIQHPINEKVTYLGQCPLESELHLFSRLLVIGFFNFFLNRINESMFNSFQKHASKGWKVNLARLTGVIWLF